MAEKTQAELRAERRAEQRARLEAEARGSDEHLTEQPAPDELDEIEEPEIEEPPRGPVMDDPWPERRRFLLSLIRDPELRDEITDEELRAMDARITKKAHDERRKAAMAAFEDEMLHRARVDEGLKDPKTLRTMDENARLASKVRVRFVLPGDGSGHQGPNGFRIDGRIIENGQWVEMTMAEYESRREEHYAAHLAEVQFSTLDQARKAGLGMNHRAQGTTAARVLMSRSPHIMEVEPILV
jgi:hypothetical protein